MKRARLRLVLALLLYASTTTTMTTAARAEPFTSLGDAGVVGAGAWSTGLFAPLRIGLGDTVELRAQVASWLLLSPDVGVRIAHVNRDSLRVSSNFGLWLPTPSMRILKGLLFPSWATSEQNVGWFAVPSAGVAVSGGRRAVFTARAEVALGLLPSGHNDARPLDTYAPIELLFAPALNRFRASLHLSYDHALLDWLRVRAEVGVHAIGTGSPPRSPWFVSGGAGADVALGRRFRLSLGFLWFNYDSHAQELVRAADRTFERRNVRSNDVYPTLDLVWRYDKK